MKYISLVFLCLTSCLSEDYSNNFIKKAKDFCECHKGVQNLIFNNYSYDLVCNDGYSLNGTGSIETQHLYSECKK